MDEDTQDKLQRLMQMAMLAAQQPVPTGGYGLFPPSPFESFPAPQDEIVSPQDVFPLPGGMNG